jgi:adenylate cyclase
MQLSVLDCDLVGFSALAARMAPEAVAAGLRAYHAYVEETVFASGGAVLKYIGDGVIAVFGFTGVANPAGQARDCAERLVAGWGASGAFETPLELVVGVDHGEVVAGIVGEGRALSLIVAGPPVEGAARLQSLRGDQPAVRLGY